MKKFAIILSLLISASLFSIIGCSGGSQSSNAAQGSNTQAATNLKPGTISNDFSQDYEFSGVIYHLGDDWTKNISDSPTSVARHELKQDDYCCFIINTYKDGKLADETTHKSYFGQTWDSSGPPLVDSWEKDGVTYWLYKETHSFTDQWLIGSAGESGFIIKCHLSKKITNDTNDATMTECLHEVTFMPKGVKYDTNEERAEASASQSNTSNTAITTANISDDDKGQLVANAQDCVKDQLKAPSTAKFPWSFDEYSFIDLGASSEHAGYTTYQVNGYVDAQNAYGANLRANFTVVMDYKSGNDTYYLKSCNVDG